MQGIKGTLSKMLIQLNEDEKEVFKTYVPKDNYAQLYAESWLEDSSSDMDENMPLHEFVSMFSKRDFLHKSSDSNQVLAFKNIVLTLEN